MEPVKEIEPLPEGVVVQISILEGSRYMVAANLNMIRGSQEAGLLLALAAKSLAREVQHVNRLSTAMVEQLEAEITGAFDEAMRRGPNDGISVVGISRRGR